MADEIELVNILREELNTKQVDIPAGIRTDQGQLFLAISEEGLHWEIRNPTNHYLVWRNEVGPKTRPTALSLIRNALSKKSRTRRSTGVVSKPASSRPS